MAKIVTKNNLLEKAKREYKYLSSHPELRKEFEEKEMNLLDTISMLSWHEGIGEKRGKAEGEKIGSKEREREIILNMYEKNLKIEEISRLIGINKKEVQEIINKFKNEKLIIKQA